MLCGVQMPGYTKLFQSILASTIWSADDKTRLVWITLMAMADQNGVAEGSIPGLATFARVSLEDCERALRELEAPDPYSRTKEFEGRRIETVEGGWKLVNHRKYREKMNADDRREYLRRKQAERRSKRKSVNKSVNSRQQMSTLSTHAEAEAEAEATRSGLLRDLDHSLEQGNQQQAEQLPTTAPPDNGNGNDQPKKKKPLISGKALTIHDWMLTDCEKTLGGYAAEFDLLAWFWALDERAWNDGLVIPKRDGGAWLQAELVAEAQRRGLPLRFATVTKQSAWEQEIWAKRRMGL